MDEITGTCEWCGSSYNGKPSLEGEFAYVTCPDCGLQSQNFLQTFADGEVDGEIEIYQ